MKTYVRTYVLWLFLTQFFAEGEIFRTKFVEKSKQMFYIKWLLWPKSWHLWDDVKKYSRFRQAMGGIIRRVRFESWITAAKNTHSECIILIDFPKQQWLHEHVLTLRHTYSASRFRNALLFCSKLFTINGVCEFQTDSGLKTSNCVSLFTNYFNLNQFRWRVTDGLWRRKERERAVRFRRSEIFPFEVYRKFKCIILVWNFRLPHWLLYSS
jgi:hypothetical protein